MADYNINAATRRVVLSGSAGTGPYSFTFAVLVQTDLAVYLNSTKLTLTTDYTVSIATNGTGTVTLNTGTTNVPTTPGSSDSVIIVGARALERTTDFVTAGDLRASALNEQLDANVIFDQQLAEENQRTVKAPVFDPATTDGGGTVDMTLPAKDTRKGKYLAFNSTTGNPEAGPSVSDVTTVSAAATDIALLADIQDGTTATNAITTVASNNSNVTTVAGISANVTTVAGIAANVTTVAGKASLITSDFVSDLNTLATTDTISDLNTLATSDIVSDLNTLATSDIVSDINTLATSDIVSDLNTLATSDFVSDLNTLATSANVTNISTVATNIAGVTSFAERYRVASSDPSSSLDEGDLAFNTTDNNLKFYNGSAWVNITPGIANVVEDTSPQLGGTLDANGNPINVDVIAEKTSGNGVSIDGLLIKDKEIGTSAAPATLQASAINSGQIGGRRNIVINGAMNVAQRATTVTGVTASGYKTCDRFRPVITNAGTWTISQSTDAPTGFATSLKFDCTTADTSLGASDKFRLDYYIEGQDVQHLQKGSSSAKSLTMSFYVKTNKTGTYVFELNDADNSRAYSQTYTVSSADTWEKKTIVFAGDTSGAFGNDNNSSLQLHWWLASGTDFTSGTTPSGWESKTNANRAAGLNVNIADSTSNEWYITGVQLEVGSVATEFEAKSFGEELALCQRYYQKSYPLGTNAGTAVADNSKIQFSFGTEGSGIVGYNASLPVVMRANPTTTVYDGDGNSGKVDILSSGATVTHNQATNSVTGRAEFINVRIFGKTCAGMAFHYEVDAEL